jgi:hypothetical protein
MSTSNGKFIDARVGFNSVFDHEPVRSASAWAPLRTPLFRALRISSFDLPRWHGGEPRLEKTLHALTRKELK